MTSPFYARFFLGYFHKRDLTDAGVLEKVLKESEVQLSDQEPASQFKHASFLSGINSGYPERMHPHILLRDNMSKY